MKYLSLHDQTDFGSIFDNDYEYNNCSVFINPFLSLALSMIICYLAATLFQSDIKFLIQIAPELSGMNKCAPISSGNFPLFTSLSFNDKLSTHKCNYNQL